MSECVVCKNFEQNSLRSHVTGHPTPCPCHACYCVTPPMEISCYKQPDRPGPLGPPRCYIKAPSPMECDTTYNLAYRPADPTLDVRGTPIITPNSIETSTEPMEQHTVHKLSYLPHPLHSTHLMKPVDHQIFGRGPISDTTTQQHDFMPKSCVRPDSFKPSPNVPSDQPLESLSITKTSYPPKVPEPIADCTPLRCFLRPMAKMSGDTTHNTSYKPIENVQREKSPYSHAGQIGLSPDSLDAITTYNLTYYDKKSDCRRHAILPIPGSNPVTGSRDFDHTTVYSSSYQPAYSPVPDPIRPVHNIFLSRDRLDGTTVHQTTFGPKPLAMTQTIWPCRRNILGSGPLQDTTSQRHDFIPQPYSVRESCKPISEGFGSDKPFKGYTETQLSYTDPGRMPVPASFKPIPCYSKPTEKMEFATTHQTSYKPTGASAPQRVRAEPYKAPDVKVEGTSVYSSTYQPPGEDCTEYKDPVSYGPCKPCTCVCPTECIHKNVCACGLLKAACCS